MHNHGCGKQLAKGQWWGFCGETDMGQTLPALCTECGGHHILADKNEYDMGPAYKELSNNKAFNMLIERGWQIHRASCGCGGNYMWMKPRGTGAFESVGCLCHTDAIKLVKDLIIKDAAKSITKDKLEEDLFEI